MIRFIYRSGELGGREDPPSFRDEVLSHRHVPRLSPTRADKITTDPTQSIYPTGGGAYKILCDPSTGQG